MESNEEKRNKLFRVRTTPQTLKEIKYNLGIMVAKLNLIDDTQKYPYDLLILESLKRLRFETDKDFPTLPVHTDTMKMLLEKSTF